MAGESGLGVFASFSVDRAAVKGVGEAEVGTVGTGDKTGLEGTTHRTGLEGATDVTGLEGARDATGLEGIGAAP